VVWTVTARTWVAKETRVVAIPLRTKCELHDTYDPAKKDAS
jgi:hypothetical protein